MGKRANYYDAVPLDFVILELLPDHGMIGGIHWRGLKVKDLRKSIVASSDEITEDLVPPSTIQSRLRSMHVAGLVVNHRAIGASGALIWARLPEGVEFLKTKKEVLGLAEEE